MKRPGRTLTLDEAALWRRLTDTVRPLRRSPHLPPPEGAEARNVDGASAAIRNQSSSPAASRTRPPGGPPTPAAEDRRAMRPLDRSTLDASWDRRLATGVVQPDFTLDLHGHTLDSAHARLDHGLTQALAQGARVLLLITGKPRNTDDHSPRGERRGAIRAKFLDWLAAGPHASRIAAIRPAHPRHGGAGAVYVVLKRAR
jgi:DNA-nicking Smr family endonuclease